MGAQGTQLVDFGAFPGASDTSFAITGQGSILSTSLVEAWLLPAATADHTADEHWVETIKVVAGNIVAGTGFTIYAINTGTIFENTLDSARTGDLVGYIGPPMGKGTLIYGKWNVGWVWN
jgi:hypothetical protein